MLVPELPHVNDANLWHQWLGENIALDSTRRASGDGTDRVPFPDPLVALLPPVARRRADRRASVAMLWMFTLAASIALTSSGWQNARLLRQVSADIGLYRALAPVQRPDEPVFALRENAAKVLLQHAVSLEDHYRNGVPLSLGLGLYRADRLRVPLLATLADYRSPLPANTAHVLDPIRLNSLSLFAVGSARLKPDSTKVLIQALHRLRAQPGWLIVITGHTDATGPAEHNLQLSRARAEAVRDWMQRMGEIHDSCFAVQGLGASQPIASNDIAAGRSANRRVDIRLVPEAGACLSSPPMPDINPPSHEAA
jgi:outer membrane protein OmpA-like peptidoglycan-associated protein